MKKLLHEEIARVPADRIGEIPRHPIILVVDNVRSLYNVGSMFRSCDGALVQKVYLCGYTPFPPRKEISKTALGATETVPWEYANDIAKALSSLKMQGIRIAALEHTNRSVSCFSLRRVDFPLAVVVGNEVTGLSDTALSYCDMAIEIPMFGTKQSLNVAVATGILLFECVRALHHG